MDLMEFEINTKYNTKNLEYSYSRILEGKDREPTFQMFSIAMPPEYVLQCNECKN
jgi:hypothetical protein